MIKLLKNFILRVLTHKEIIVIAVIVMPIMIAAGVMFTNIEKKETIAYVGEDTEKIPNDSRMNIERKSKMPTKVDLVFGVYNFVVEKQDKKYTIITLNNKQDKAAIRQFFETGYLPKDYKSEDEIFKERGMGTNILGFTMMLVLMQGVAVGTLFTEDRQKGTFRRILMAPMNVPKYLVSHNVFIFVAIFVPSAIALFLFKAIFSINIGFSNLTLLLLLSLMCLLSAAFASLLTSGIDRNVNLIASAITIVTCIVSGCFIPFAENNKIASFIFSTLPQKSYLNIVENITHGNQNNNLASLVIILTWMLLFWVSSSLIVKKKINKGYF